MNKLWEKENIAGKPVFFTFPSVFYLIKGKTHHLNQILFVFNTHFQFGKPFCKKQILDPSNLKEFADDNFKFDENGRKLYKRLENNVGKGQIACCEQFLLFQQCFQENCIRDT